MTFRKCRVRILSFTSMKFDSPTDMDIEADLLDVVTRPVSIPMSKLSQDSREMLSRALCDTSQIGEQWVFEVDEGWLLESGIPDGAWQ